MKRLPKGFLLIALVCLQFIFSFQNIFSLPLDQTTNISIPPGTNGSVFDSSTHVDSNGNFHTVWLEALTGDDLNNNDVYYYDTLNSTTYNISTALGSGNVRVNNRNHLKKHHKITGDNVSHIIWRQEMPSGWEDVIYYNSGTNTTTNISDPVLSAGSSNQEVILKKTNGNNIYASWYQSITDPLHSVDLFLFNSATGVTANISDHASSQGGVYGNRLFIDGNNYPHVVWLEDNSTNSERGDVYYYNGSTATTKNLSQTVWAQTSSFGSSQFAAELDSNNNIHIAWFEPNNAGSNYDLFYYNGQTDTTSKLSPNTLPNGDVQRAKMLIRPNNQAYVVWVESGTDVTYDMFLWDESTATTTNLSQLLPYLNGSVGNYKFQIRQNYLGQGYVFWRENTSNALRNNVLLMYNITTSILTDISAMAAADGYVQGYSTIFDHSGNPVIAFSYFDPLSGHSSDMHVYHGRNNSVTMITNRTNSTGDVYYSNRRFPINIDNANNPHIFWLEESQNPAQGSDVYYYNGADLTTTSISRPDLSSGPVNYLFRYNTPVYIYRNSSGRLEALWKEIDSNPALSSNLYFWESDSNTTIILSDTANTGGGVRDTAILHDSAERPHVAWLEQNIVNGEGLDMYYYNIEGGIRRNISNLPVTNLGANPQYNAHFMNFGIYNGRTLFTTWAESTEVSNYTDRYVWMYELTDLPTPTPTPTVPPTVIPGGLTRTGMSIVPGIIFGLNLTLITLLIKDINKKHSLSKFNF